MINVGGVRVVVTVDKKTKALQILVPTEASVVVKPDKKGTVFTVN